MKPSTQSLKNIYLGAYYVPDTTMTKDKVVNESLASQML